MTREERELRVQIESLKAEARKLVSEHKSDEAEAKLPEIEALTKEADLLAKLEADEIQGAQGKQAGEIKDEKEEEKRYSEAFFKAFRRKKLSAEDREILTVRNALSETGGDPEGADGGFLVPQDIQTRINEFKRSLPSLERFVNVVPVTTLSGSRVFEKVADMTPLANITEDTADLDAMDNPTFEQVTYSIKKYAGWLPVPNDLIKDTDQNIIAYLTKWIGKKSVVTRNTLILAILQALTPDEFDDYNGIKKALNVDLDAMLSAGAIILTNQWGFHYLDTLEDGSGKPILQVDITQPSRKLFAGKPLEVVPNSVLANDDGNLAPIFIGNVAELVTMFERQGHQIDSTNIGGTAFRKDRTELRVIEREDVKAVDDEAVIYGQIDVTAFV